MHAMRVALLGEALGTFLLVGPLLGGLAGGAAYERVVGPLLPRKMPPGTEGMTG